MNTKTKIAIDLMGGDDHPDSRLQALKEAAQQNQNIGFRVFVSKSYYEIVSHQSAFDNSNIEFFDCERSVSMSDTAYDSIREKRNSSLSKAIQDVANGDSDVCLTAGNTGAMVAFAKYWLKPIISIDKPVLSVLLPSTETPSLLLDVGATIDASADDLYQFSKLGSAWMQAIKEVDEPRVALLNVGLETTKGNDTIRQASSILESSGLNYIGFCEGSHLFSGFADVIVCNGLIGNIALKSCEGMAIHIQKSRKIPKSTFWAKFRKDPQTLEPDKYNGALLLGLDGLVVKSHGNCNENSFNTAINEAINMAKTSLIEKMTKHLEKN